MADIDEVIEALEKCISNKKDNCYHCPYLCQCEEGEIFALKDDALELLKEQRKVIDQYSKKITANKYKAQIIEWLSIIIEDPDGWKQCYSASKIKSLAGKALELLE